MRSELSVVDVTRYVDLYRAHELAVRQSELYEAMLIVEQCGASPELTAAVDKLNARMRQLTADLKVACRDGLGEKPAPEPCPMCKGLGTYWLGGIGIQQSCMSCGGTGRRKRL